MVLEKENYIYISVKEGVEALPVYATPGSAGADIKASRAFIIEPGQFLAVSTGIHMKIPEGYEVQIRPRSGLAFKHGITVLNSPGTIDSDYTGEISVILINHGDKRYNVMKGDRIAQMVAAPVVQCRFDIVEELEVTERGEGGFASTGR